MLDYNFLFDPAEVHSLDHTEFTTEQWDQFQKEYAGKVTELDIDVVLTPACWSIVNDLVRKHRSLCPNLQKLYTYPRREPEIDDRWMAMTALLAHPALRSVEIVQGDSSDEGMNDIIYALATKAPHIDDVSVDTLASCPDYAAFSEVKRLSVSGYFDHKAWRECAMLPKLETLELWEFPDGGEIWGLKIRWKQTYAVTFANLKTLKIHDEDEEREPDLLASIFRNTTMPLLQTIELHCTEDVDMAMIRRYLAERSPLLREINLNGEEETGPIEIVDEEDGDDEYEEYDDEASMEVEDDDESDHYQ
ncbi:hypothetical protein FRB95_002640 [Tulasnella sp. JGI-2019a]|nr:hypothetical protein FRB95_002640 [Tulasnella sp. JGI-2019a]